VTVQAVDAQDRRWSFGKLSVQIAVWTFILSWALIIAAKIFVHESPKQSPLADVVSGVVVIELIAAPFAHLVGLVLGVMALFRAGDRRVLAIIGILLNVSVVVIGLMMAYTVAQGLVAR
jgi:hypothetical protein